MALPVITPVAVTGTTASLATTVQSAVLYTVPASTNARIMSLKVTAATTSIQIYINGAQLESLASNEFDDIQVLADFFIYLSAGDEITVAQTGATTTIDYYFSILEQT